MAPAQRVGEVQSVSSYPRSLGTAVLIGLAVIGHPRLALGQRAVALDAWTLILERRGTGAERTRISRSPMTRTGGW